ncbi:hypothetical protein K0I63_16295 [Shewanella rhizosphaerae]|uniref:hypothetical protein n=1 Tax=Shewanella rhizosphaerae TaxID=2864207 RepID=UPI001C65EB6C|nr:hypothetical protein [Shewanella rhizosphaerae]QYK12283.1 hypothetical protein K0I63_16295 [Shewanella rhizosphaerae]
MSGYSDYGELMAEWASEYMRPIVENHQKGTLTEPSKHTPFNTIFYGFTEISNTFEALKLSEVLVSVAPPRSNRINDDEYIKYLINTYLQDVYILKERLNTYATKLKRMHERCGRGSLVQAHIDPVFEFVKSSLDGLVNTRGSHVHSNRYSDDELDNVAQMALISRYNSEYEQHYKFSYKKAQRIWSSRIKSNNEATEKLLDHYFESIMKVVKVDGSVFMP